MISKSLTDDKIKPDSSPKQEAKEVLHKMDKNDSIYSYAAPEKGKVKVKIKLSMKKFRKLKPFAMPLTTRLVN